MSNAWNKKTLYEQQQDWFDVADAIDKLEDINEIINGTLVEYNHEPLPLIDLERLPSLREMVNQLLNNIATAIEKLEDEQESRM